MTDGDVFVDLHVHLGRAAGRPVKISASAALDLAGILATAKKAVGLDGVAIVDACTTGGLADLRAAVHAGVLRPLAGGGLRAADGLVVWPAAEVELDISRHRVHFVALLADLDGAASLADRLAGHVRNRWLSSQLAHGLDPAGLLAAVAGAGGVVWPAHAFTPHRGLYGCALRRAGAPPPLGLGAAVFDHFAALELGLSADTAMADRVDELAPLTFLSNSDAHGLATLGREVNRLRLPGPLDFAGLVRCLRREAGYVVVANYGLEPALGKYHRTACLRCGRTVEGPPPQLACSHCPHSRVVPGVLDRLVSIADRLEPRHPPHRPPYRPQVPLASLPGVGPRTLSRLRASLGPDLSILHRVDGDAIAAVAGAAVAGWVLAAREGRLHLRPGGGGSYGRVVGMAPRA